MNIRKAEEKDIPRLLALLGQVLQSTQRYARIFLFPAPQNTPSVNWQRF